MGSSMARVHISIKSMACVLLTPACDVLVWWFGAWLELLMVVLLLHLLMTPQLDPC
jgi:hypothetical protein